MTVELTPEEAVHLIVVLEGAARSENPAVVNAAIVLREWRRALVRTFVIHQLYIPTQEATDLP